MGQLFHPQKIVKCASQNHSALSLVPGASKTEKAGILPAGQEAKDAVRDNIKGKQKNWYPYPNFTVKYSMNG